MNNKHAGFTLIEIMMVVIIIAVLAAFAYPSYVDSVRKSKRSDAVNALLALKSAQEKFRTNCIFYADAYLDDNGTDDDDETCNAANAGVGDLGFDSNSSPNGFYTVAITDGSASGIAYTATATAVGDQANDTDCNVFTLTVSAGTETFAPDDCI